MSLLDHAMRNLGYVGLAMLLLGILIGAISLTTTCTDSPAVSALTGVPTCGEVLIPAAFGLILFIVGVVVAITYLDRDEPASLMVAASPQQQPAGRY
ncbi:MAG: hypothetical protein ACREB9_05430, partial [Thermoplasmata archaeon]